MSKLSLKLQNIEEMNKKILNEGEGMFGGPDLSERTNLMVKLKETIVALINTGVNKQELLNKMEVFLNNRN